jgi:hypothetical protein
MKGGKMKGKKPPSLDGGLRDQNHNLLIFIVT